MRLLPALLPRCGRTIGRRTKMFMLHLQAGPSPASRRRTNPIRRWGPVRQPVRPARNFRDVPQCPGSEARPRPGRHYYDWPFHSLKGDECSESKALRAGSGTGLPLGRSPQAVNPQKMTNVTARSRPKTCVTEASSTFARLPTFSVFLTARAEIPSNVAVTADRSAHTFSPCKPGIISMSRLPDDCVGGLRSYVHSAR